MSDGVWMSSVLGNSEIGHKLGLRRKPFGQDWDPEGHAPPPVGHVVIQSLNRYTRGEAVARDELPEAAAVWDEKSFKRAKDIFTVGGFYCVKGKLADVLSRFDLGEGGLIPFPVYQADLETPYPGEFFLLNFGAIKNTILPEQCEDATKFLTRKDTGLQIWHINRFKPEAEIVLSSQALAGPDLWFEDAAHDKIFVSDALAQALIGIGIGDVFKLRPCRIAGGSAGMQANLWAAVLALALFGFLALMAWTGMLTGIDGHKVRLFSWIVEDMAVANFGRVGATVLFAGLGLGISGITVTVH